MIRVFVARERDDGTVLPVRFLEPDIELNVDVDLWKANNFYLKSQHVFVTTNEPKIQGVAGYLDFEGVMLPTDDDAVPPPWGGIFSKGWHGTRIYRYFIGLQHLKDGSVYQL